MTRRHFPEERILHTVFLYKITVC